MEIITKSKEQEIIEACATDRSDWDQNFNGPDDQDVQTARGLLQASFRPVNTMAFGKLDKFPSEILLDILEHLDITSLLRFRWVNHKARYAVSSMRKLAVVVEQAMSAPYMVLRTGVGRYFTLDHFYTVVTGPNCYICGNFGPFLYLCAMERCCCDCIELSNEPQLLPYDAFVEASLSCGHRKHRQPQRLVPVVSLIYGIHYNVGLGETKRVVSKSLAKNTSLSIQPSSTMFMRTTSWMLARALQLSGSPGITRKLGFLRGGLIAKKLWREMLLMIRSIIYFCGLTSWTISSHAAGVRRNGSSTSRKSSSRGGIQWDN